MGSKNIYVEFLMRWLWLLALGMVFALTATHFALGNRVPLYRATATVQVGRAIQEENPQQDQIAITAALVPAYAELAKRDPVLQAVATELEIPLSADDIRARLLVSPVPRTQWLDIQVVDAVPERAAAIANEIARQLVLQSPDNQQDSTQEFIQAQLIDLQQKISRAQTDIATLQDDIAEMSSAADITDAQQRLAALQLQVDSWQQSYASLVVAIEPSSTNIVTIVSAATTPLAPLQTSTLLYYGLAAVIGVGLATMLALGLNLLNGVVQKTFDVALLGGSVPVIPVPQYRVPLEGAPIAFTEPNSSPTAAYRVLRNALQTHGADRSRGTIAVTSSRSGEGKTTTAANLAIAIANTGRSVIVVDANFHNPELGNLFGIVNGRGLSDLISTDIDAQSVLQTTTHDHLQVVTAGTIPETYADLLSSPRLTFAVDQLAALAEIVLFDCPAVREERESLLLAREVSGVVIIAEARRVRMAELAQTVELVRGTDPEFITVVLNKTKPARLTTDRLPWSREARLRKRAATHRASASRVATSPAVDRQVSGAAE